MARSHAPRMPAIAALALALSLIGGCSPRITDDIVERVDTAEVARRLERAGGQGAPFLLDARDVSAYSQGHLPGAIRVSLANLPEQMRGIPHGRAMIVYADNPASGLAMAVSKRLIERGYKRVLLYESGLDAWRASGRPVK